MSHFEEPLKIHDTLNPVLWKNNTLKSDVRKALLKIALEYYKFLGIKTQINDIVISGSQANYNYNEKSDIDLHLIVDYSTVSCDMDIDELFDTKRKLWKEQRNIVIHNIPVEVYVEDLNKPAVSSTYSLIEEKWIKKPEKINVSIDQDRVDNVALAWMTVISAALGTMDAEKVDEVKDMLWAYRKAGLAKEGEMGVPNLVFKTLRNSGVTEMLLSALGTLRDRDLSLENQSGTQ